MQKRTRPTILGIDKRVLQDFATYRPDPGRLGSAFAAAGGQVPVAPAGRESEFAEHVASAVALHLSTIATGEKLVRDPTFFAEVRAVHDKVEVVEMEAFGFAEACQRAGVPWLVVRGISDFGDKFKDDRFHAFAATTAAVALAATEGGEQARGQARHVICKINLLRRPQ